MTIEQIEPAEHIDELVKLARIEYGDSEIANPAYLRWQYLDNPAGQAIVVVARGDGGVLAGQYVVVPMMFRLGTELVMGSLSLNTLTHPDYRGRGLFTKMANETYSICERKGLNITLGFPNKNSYPGFVRKLDFKHMGNASVLFRLQSPLRLLRSLPSVKGTSKYGQSAIDDNKVASSNYSRDSMRVTDLDFDVNSKEFDSLIDNQVESRFGVYKTARFCCWRFQNIPTRKYRAFQIDDGSGSRAACVARVRRVRGIECVFIIDLQLANGSVGDEEGRLLLQAVVDTYKKAGTVLGGIMVNAGSRADFIAKSVGFRAVPRRLLPHDAPIILRRNGKAVDDSVFDLAMWELSFGDYDVL